MIAMGQFQTFLVGICEIKYWKFERLMKNDLTGSARKMFSFFKIGQNFAKDWLPGC